MTLRDFRKAEFRAPREKLLPFATKEDATFLCFEASPRMPFKPTGLLLWNVSPLDEVSACYVGRDTQLTATFEPVPAAWFASAYSFEEVEKRAELGKYPATWGHWNVAEPGVIIRIEVRIKDPATDRDRVRALMWGWGFA